MKYNILATVFSFFLIGLALLISPDVSYAQAGGLVPCDGPKCNLCDLAKLAENVINFMVQISFVIAALLFAYAGFLFFTGGSDPGKISSARNVLTNTLVGVIIVLTAWLVVNVILTTLTGQGVNPFTKVLCEGVFKTPSKIVPWNNPDTVGDTDGTSNIKVEGTDTKSETYRWSAIADVTYESGAKGRTRVGAGPFSSQQECYASLLDPSQYIANTKEVLIVSFRTDCNTPI